MPGENCPGSTNKISFGFVHPRNAQTKYTALSNLPKRFSATLYYMVRAAMGILLIADG